MADNYERKVHWSINGKNFRNKYQALSYLNESHGGLTDLRFHLFDGCFSSLDWSREPAESFETLLKRRALQVRESYDYIRLWYSGGSDSHTMLRTFIENKIPIDEILVYRCSPIHDFENIGNSEVNKVALPFLTEIKNLIPKTKVTLLDIGKTQYEQAYREGWMGSVNVLRFRPYSRACLYSLFPQLSRPSDQGLRHCDLVGKDKPRLKIRNGRYYAYCWDGLYAAVVGDPFVEYFFVTDALPELHLKQCHLVKRWHQANAERYPDIDWLFEEDNYATIDTVCRHPLWVPYSLYKTGELKSPKAEEALHHAAQELPHLYQGYMSGLQTVENQLSRFCNDGKVRNGFVGVRSLEYDMGA